MTRWMTQNRYHFVIKMYGSNPRSCATLLPVPENLRAEGLQMLVTKTDFESIYSTSMLWKGQGWESQAGRFVEGTSFHWPCAYWFDSRTDMVIARQFLENYGFEYQQTYDGTMDNWLILTDYVADVWVSELAAK